MADYVIVNNNKNKMLLDAIIALEKKNIQPGTQNTTSNDRVQIVTSHRLPKSFSWNQSVKAIIEVPRTRGNSTEHCWNQPCAATPFTKL